ALTTNWLQARRAPGAGPAAASRPVLSPAVAWASCQYGRPAAVAILTWSSSSAAGPGPSRSALSWAGTPSRRARPQATPTSDVGIVSGGARAGPVRCSRPECIGGVPFVTGDRTVVEAMRWINAALLDSGFGTRPVGALLLTGTTVLAPRPHPVRP